MSVDRIQIGYVVVVRDPRSGENAAHVLTPTVYATRELGDARADRYHKRHGTQEKAIALPCFIEVPE